MVYKGWLRPPRSCRPPPPCISPRVRLPRGMTASPAPLAWRPAGVVWLGAPLCVWLGRLLCAFRAPPLSSLSLPLRVSRASPLSPSLTSLGLAPSFLWQKHAPAGPVLARCPAVALAVPSPASCSLCSRAACGRGVSPPSLFLCAPLACLLRVPVLCVPPPRVSRGGVLPFLPLCVG